MRVHFTLKVQSEIYTNKILKNACGVVFIKYFLIKRIITFVFQNTKLVFIPKISKRKKLVLRIMNNCTNTGRRNNLNYLVLLLLLFLFFFAQKKIIIIYEEEI